MRSVEVVEDLFGNIPISGYLAMNMGGIPLMNDAVGGVTLTVLQDVSFPENGVDLREGETVQLSGTEAYYYLHGRDVDEYDSATKRLRREEQYIMAYMETLRGLGASKTIALYDEIEDYLVTSVDFTSLITELMNYEFSEDAMYTVPGETSLGDPIGGECYEEYHVDQDALQDLIMQVFYEPAE
jgi:anionic cell wall polymer biosynthesis LytR-Cps2A-Psr (LCP) family protein